MRSYFVLLALGCLTAVVLAAPAYKLYNVDMINEINFLKKQMESIMHSSKFNKFDK